MVLIFSCITFFILSIRKMRFREMRYINSSRSQWSAPTNSQGFQGLGELMQGKH